MRDTRIDGGRGRSCDSSRRFVLTLIKLPCLCSEHTNNVMMDATNTHLSVLVVGGGLHDGLRTLRGVVALENARTDKHTCGDNQERSTCQFAGRDGDGGRGKGAGMAWQGL